MPWLAALDLFLARPEPDDALPLLVGVVGAAGGVGGVTETETREVVARAGRVAGAEGPGEDEGEAYKMGWWDRLVVWR